MALASEDVIDSHRRTILGPLWPLLNYLLFAGTIILVVGPGQHGVNFTAYVATGLLVWTFINETIGQSTTLFLREEGFIKGTILPVSIFIFRQTMLSTIRAAYALVGAAALVIWSGINYTPALWSIIPAILLILITAPAVTILFAMTGVFFRDFQFIVSHVMRLMMFLSPIFWVHSGEQGLRGIIYYWNPLTHYIDLVREPVVNGAISYHAWVLSGSISAVALIAAILVLGRFNRRIVYML